MKIWKNKLYIITKKNIFILNKCYKCFDYSKCTGCPYVQIDQSLTSDIKIEGLSI